MTFVYAILGILQSYDYLRTAASPSYISATSVIYNYKGRIANISITGKYTNITKGKSAQIQTTSTNFCSHV